MALELKAPSEEIAQIFYAHPSLYESIREEALAVDKRALNIWCFMRDKHMPNPVTPLIAVLSAGLICAVDLVSKVVVVKHLKYGQLIELMPSLNLVHAVNNGAAFGLLATAGGWQRYLFIAVAMLASAFLIHMIRKPAIGSLERLGLAMILGGAVGNLVDRTVRMGVVDWIDLYAGRYHWPAFNIADVAITLGAAVLISNELFRARKNVCNA